MQPLRCSWGLRRGRSVSKWIGQPRRLVRFHKRFNIDINNGRRTIPLPKYKRGVEAPKSFPILVPPDAFALRLENFVRTHHTKRPSLSLTRISCNPRLSQWIYWNRPIVLKIIGRMKNVDDFLWGSFIARNWSYVPTSLLQRSSYSFCTCFSNGKTDWKKG